MRHKHADVIHAWAEGEEIQYKAEGVWYNWNFISTPAFYDDCEYRIKPKLVKKEGWVNVYRSSSITAVYPSEEEANVGANRSVHKRITCIRIEWEEEE